MIDLRIVFFLLITMIGCRTSRVSDGTVPKIGAANPPTQAISPGELNDLPKPAVTPTTLAGTPVVEIDSSEDEEGPVGIQSDVFYEYIVCTQEKCDFENTDVTVLASLTAIEPGIPAQGAKILIRACYQARGGGDGLNVKSCGNPNAYDIPAPGPDRNAKLKEFLLAEKALEQQIYADCEALHNAYQTYLSKNPESQYAELLNSANSLGKTHCELLTLGDYEELLAQSESLAPPPGEGENGGSNNRAIAGAFLLASGGGAAVATYMLWKQWKATELAAVKLQAETEAKINELDGTILDLEARQAKLNPGSYAEIERMEMELDEARSTKQGLEADKLETEERLRNTDSGGSRADFEFEQQRLRTMMEQKDFSEVKKLIGGDFDLKIKEADASARLADKLDRIPQNFERRSGTVVDQFDQMYKPIGDRISSVISNFDRGKGSLKFNLLEYKQNPLVSAMHEAFLYKKQFDPNWQGAGMDFDEFIRRNFNPGAIDAGVAGLVKKQVALSKAKSALSKNSGEKMNYGKFQSKFKAMGLGSEAHIKKIDALNVDVTNSLNKLLDTSGVPKLDSTNIVRRIESQRVRIETLQGNIDAKRINLSQSGELAESLDGHRSVRAGLSDGAAGVDIDTGSAARFKMIAGGLFAGAAVVGGLVFLSLTGEDPIPPALLDSLMKTRAKLKAVRAQSELLIRSGYKPAEGQ